VAALRPISLYSSIADKLWLDGARKRNRRSVRSARKSSQATEDRNNPICTSIAASDKTLQAKHVCFLCHGEDAAN
jgi:hypothetical protein